MSDFENGEHLGHYACPKHGGSDSLSLYMKSNGVIDGNCWAECGKIKPKELKELGITDGKGEVLVEPVKASKGGTFVMTDEVMEKVTSVLDIDVNGWKERKIPLVVNDFYGVRSEVDENKSLIREYCPVYNQQDELVGWHVRNDAAKQAKNRGEKVDGVPFYAIGNNKSSTKLFGQNKFEAGGKYVVLCSGQADARAVFTALNVERVWSAEHGRKIPKLNKFITPVVSTQCGEGSLAQIKANYEWITSFENVIILYDQDKAGRIGAEKVAKMMKAGQARIGKYKRKDACEHSKLGEWNDIRHAFFKAERYSPVDILSLAEMWEDFEKEDQNIKITFPNSMPILNDMMGGGMERGEITVIGALTSAGKSTFVNNMVYHLLDTTELKVGAFYLEGTKREVVRDLLSLELSENLRLKNRDDLDMNVLRNRFMNRLAAKDRFAFVNHAGSIGSDEIFDKLNYLAEVESCDVIFFDPLQAGVNSSDNSLVIEFMDRMLKFAKKTDTCVVIVSHMKKPDTDNPHHVSEYSLLGSSVINQIAFNTVLISRDKLHENEKVRNSTRLLLVKCRRTGQTSEAGWVRFDPKTSHLYATSNPYKDLEEIPEEFLDMGYDEDDDSENEQEEATTDEWEVED